MLRNSIKILNKIILIIVLFVSPSIVFAGEYYVSPSGSASWSSCTNINTPCSPQTAMSNAMAGDTVYFRGGTYNIPFTGWEFQRAELEPAHSGTAQSPIIFKNYPGEVPIFNCTGMPAWNNGDKKTQQAQILGNGFHEYITFEGFHLIAEGGERMASIGIFGPGTDNRVQGIELRNLVINGGSRNVTVDTNNDLIRVENTDGTIIVNCKLYSNRNVNSSEDDTCAIKMYHNSNALIEHNEIYDCNTGIYLKSDDDDIEVRYNWVNDVVNCIRFINENGMESYRVSVHDNLFTNFSNSSNWVDSSHGYYNNDHAYYNNTLYSASAGFGFAIGEVQNGFKFYNNIVFVNASTTLMRTRQNTNISECDHNNWGGNNFDLQLGIWGAERHYRSLSNWQNSDELSINHDSGCGYNRHPGCGSLAVSPNFVNSSGSFNKIVDFKLAANSPCKGAGRNGVDMGANIDLVGVISSGQSGAPPSSPPNLRKLGQ